MFVACRHHDRKSMHTGSRFGLGNKLARSAPRQESPLNYGSLSLTCSSFTRVYPKIHIRLGFDVAEPACPSYAASVLLVIDAGR